ncbi:hypothetical protein ACWCSD_01305 [Nonomuraea sp. NPDC001684]
MLHIAIIATAACLAVPVAIFIRMLVTGPRARAEIHMAFQINAQGATSSAKTPVAPRNPAPSNGNEVTSS